MLAREQHASQRANWQGGSTLPTDDEGELELFHRSCNEGKGAVVEALQLVSSGGA